MSISVKPDKNTVLFAQITRADGTVQNIGQIAGTYHNPLRQLWWDTVGKRFSDRRIKIATANRTKEMK